MDSGEILSPKGASEHNIQYEVMSLGARWGNALMIGTNCWSYTEKGFFLPLRFCAFPDCKSRWRYKGGFWPCWKLGRRRIHLFCDHRSRAEFADFRYRLVKSLRIAPLHCTDNRQRIEPGNLLQIYSCENSSVQTIYHLKLGEQNFELIKATKWYFPLIVFMKLI